MYSREPTEDARAHRAQGPKYLDTYRPNTTQWFQVYSKLLLLFQYLYNKLGNQHQNIDFHKPESVDEIVSIDIPGRTMQVVAGEDLVEDICLWCAYSILIGNRITAW